MLCLEEEMGSMEVGVEVEVEVEMEVGVEVKIFLASWRQVSGFFGGKSIQSLYAAKTVMALALACIQANANAMTV